jgi:transcription antitermination factor NusG
MKPYFPGYLFVSIDPVQDGFSNLQWLPGAIGIVNIGGEPASVPDRLLEAIRTTVDQINQYGLKSTYDLKAGDLVTITAGPLAGYQAIFDVRLPGSERVRVFLQMLQDRQVCVNLPRWQLERIKPH